MSNIHNPKNITGMADLLADDEDDINIEEIEASVIQGTLYKSKPQKINYADLYTKELEELSTQYKMPGVKIDYEQDAGTTAEDSTLDELFNSTRNIVTKKTIPESSYKVEADPDWSTSYAKDEQLSKMTNEEVKRSHISNVLENIDRNNPDSDYINQEDEEDEMARISEQVDLLRSNLEAEGVDLSRIPEITSTTTKKDAKSTLKILQIKNDRLRYCDFFEEGILAVAYGLEGVFNGQREIFGSKVDLTGYSDTVKVKLRRMRYDTSNFVSNIMQGYNISSGWRIVLELIPSLFLYSRDRRLKANDNLMSDADYQKAMHNITPN